MIEPIHNIDNNNNNEQENEKENLLLLNNKKPLISNEQLELHKNSNLIQINSEQKK